MTGWLYVVLCAASSVVIAHFLKFVESKKLDTIRVLTVNYFTATVIAFLVTGTGEVMQLDLQEGFFALGLATVVGVIFIANYFIYSKSVHHNGVGISVAAMRISLLVPVLLSTAWYLELLTFRQWIGVFLVFITLFLLLPNKRKMLHEPFSAAWLLVLLFVGTGIGDASLKVYEVEFSALLSKEYFMGIVFMTAFVIGLIVSLVQKKGDFNKMEVLLGVAIGVPNLYSAIFLIEALERMNGAVVYSSVNVLTVLGGTMLGIIKWGDLLTKVQWTGILFTIISILLLI